MATMTASAITAMQAYAETFGFLNDRLPDRIMPGLPRLDAAAQVWCVPIVLAYPDLGILGELGEVVISLQSGQVVAYTSIEEIDRAADSLIEKHRDAIE